LARGAGEERSGEAAVPRSVTAGSDSVVQPGHALGRKPSQHVVPYLRGGPTRMVDVVPDESRGELHAGGAQVARLLVGQRGAREVAARLLELLREHDAVLDGHGRALRHVLEGRVRRVAKERYEAFAPFLARLAVAEDPHPPGLDEVQ